MFENKTSETGIESVFAGSLIYELSRDGRMTVSPQEMADAVVTGIIRNMYIDTVARKTNYIALERKVNACVDLTLKDSGNRVLWSGKNICDSEAYLVSDEKLVTEKNRRAALKKISEKIAQKFYQRLFWEQ